MTRTPRSFSLLLPVVVAALLAFSAPGALAQNIETVAEREIARRQAGLPQGNEALARAKVSMQSGDYLRAHEDYRLAVTYLPDAAVSGQGRAEAVRGFAESGVKVAERRVQEGKYGEAEAICRDILSDQYDPNYRPAMLLLTRLREPGQINRTMGPKFIEKVEEVRRLLTDADGYYNSGRYDLAFKKYEQILNLDPYNVAARRGQEKINNQKTRYGEEAYNEARSRSVWEVQKAWERPVRQYGQTAAPGVDAFARDATGTARISNKLNTIIIPRIEFRDASIREAMDFLRQQAAANDPATEGRRGVDIVLRLNQIGGTSVAPAPASLAPIPGAESEDEDAEPTGAPSPAMVAPAPPLIAPTDARITITLNQIPLGEALRYIASQAGLKVKVEPYAVSIIPVSEQSSDMFTKEYRVPPSFLTGNVTPSAASLNQPAAVTAASGGTGKDTQESTGGRLLVSRETAKDFLAAQGVAFPAGASANFLPQSSRLIVRNTQDNLELVDALVEQAAVSGPQQVEIEAKFVEITQNNLKELGFDWLLGNFGVGGNKVRLGGGSSGTGSELNQGDFPYSINDTNPVTAGNRSGNLAISGNAIDTLLLGLPGGQVLAPGIFGVGGLLTNPQFQVVVRALNQKKGVDLLSAPRVTTKSGQRAVIEIVREFRYPTQFDPPTIPQTFRSDTIDNSDTLNPIPDPASLTRFAPASSFPVTPTTPTAFETRNTGVTLEVEPVVGPDGVTIDLNLVPQVVEFEGFINYGSPIQTTSTNALGMTRTNVITPNIINQPVFSTRKVTTSVSVWDGQTVVLGGLMREDVQKTEDRTPIIGDIPLIGRLFRSNAEQHIKRNLIIFVTARLMNPGGQLVNQTEEVEETEDYIQPPELPPVPMYKK
jgi:general secretion pathway protein D